MHKMAIYYYMPYSKACQGVFVDGIDQVAVTSSLAKWSTEETEGNIDENPHRRSLSLPLAHTKIKARMDLLSLRCDLFWALFLI